MNAIWRPPVYEVFYYLVGVRCGIDVGDTATARLGAGRVVRRWDEVLEL